jgi:hypothetical protein
MTGTVPSRKYTKYMANSSFKVDGRRKFLRNPTEERKLPKSGYTSGV